MSLLGTKLDDIHVDFHQTKGVSFLDPCRINSNFIMTSIGFFFFKIIAEDYDLTFIFWKGGIVKNL